MPNFEVTRALTVYDRIVVEAENAEEARAAAAPRSSAWTWSFPAGEGDDPEIIDVKELT